MKNTSNAVQRENDGPLVFVVQNQHFYDKEVRVFKPKFDLAPAEVFGDLVEVLSPTAAPFNFESVVDELHEKLRNYRDGDYLLLIGNPAFIGAITAIASGYNEGRVTVLQWSGKDRRYMPIQMFDLLPIDSD